VVAHGVEVRLFVHLGSTPSVDGHPAELPEALTNLILNAVDALPRGGDIILTTRAAAGGVSSSRRTSCGCEDVREVVASFQPIAQLRQRDTQES